jgi:hypothetical protein
MDDMYEAPNPHNRVYIVLPYGQTLDAVIVDKEPSDARP